MAKINPNEVQVRLKVDIKPGTKPKEIDELLSGLVKKSYTMFTNCPESSGVIYFTPSSINIMVFKGLLSDELRTCGYKIYPEKFYRIEREFKQMLNTTNLSLYFLFGYKENGNFAMAGYVDKELEKFLAFNPGVESFERLD